MFFFGTTIVVGFFEAVDFLVTDVFFTDVFFCGSVVFLVVFLLDDLVVAIYLHLNFIFYTR